MFVFSDVHSHQGEDAVQQALVFPTRAMKEKFDTAHKLNCERIGVENANILGMGAIYIFRSTRTREMTWVASIRCGTTGVELWRSLKQDTTVVGPFVRCCDEMLKTTHASLAFVRQMAIETEGKFSEPS